MRRVWSDSPKLKSSMRKSPLRDYTQFLNALVGFAEQHSLSAMPKCAVFRASGRDDLYWAALSFHAGRPIQEDLERRLGRTLLDRCHHDRAWWLKYENYLARFRQFVARKGLRWFPSAGELISSGSDGAALRVVLVHHHREHDIARDLGLRFKLTAPKIPPRYFADDDNVRDLFRQFLKVNDLNEMPAWQHRGRYRCGYRLGGFYERYLSHAGSWEATAHRLGLTLSAARKRRLREPFTKAEVTDDLRRFCDKIGHFPRTEEFDFYGVGYLMARVRLVYGRLRLARAALGLPDRLAPLPANDGHPCTSARELAVDNALSELGIAHEREIQFGERGNSVVADFVLTGTTPPVAMEVLMFDPQRPRWDSQRCKFYLARFAQKEKIYASLEIPLLIVVPSDLLHRKRLLSCLSEKLAQFGVPVGDAKKVAPINLAPTDRLSRMPKEHWTDPEVLSAEVRRVLQEHGCTEMPNLHFFVRIKRFDLKAAINQYTSREALALRLDMPLQKLHYKPRGYWLNRENLVTGIREFISAHRLNRFPKYRDLTRERRHDLHNAFSYWGRVALEQIASELGFPNSTFRQMEM